jgi:hypothetical protein
MESCSWRRSTLDQWVRGFAPLEAADDTPKISLFRDWLMQSATPGALALSLPRWALSR